MASPEWLEEAARITMTSVGAKTPGIDGITKHTFQNNITEEIESIHKELLANVYEPSPVRRIYIPKADGKKAAAWYSDSERQSGTTRDAHDNGSDMGK